METLRCPTCLGLLLDGGAKRCGSCGKKLGNRGRPVVLGEGNRIAARPALPIEWELNRRVAAENAAHDRRSRAAAKSHHPAEPVVAPTLFEAEAPAPDKARHARKTRRGGTPKPVRIAEDAPKLFETTAPPEVVEPEIRVEVPVVEAPVVEREVVSPEVLFAGPLAEPAVDRVIEPEVIEATIVEPEIPVAPRAVAPKVVAPKVVAPPREVVIPEVLFHDDAVASTEPSADAPPEMIDLDLTTEVMVEDELAERRPPARPNMFSATGRNPRVKKMTKGRRGWVVDYVVPESESKAQDSAS